MRIKIPQSGFALGAGVEMVRVRRSIEVAGFIKHTTPREECFIKHMEGHNTERRMQSVQTDIPR